MSHFHAIGYENGRRRVTSNSGFDVYVNSCFEWEIYGKNTQNTPVQQLITSEIKKLAEKRGLPVPERIYRNSGLIVHWDVSHGQVDDVLRALADLFDSEEFQTQLQSAWPSKGREVGHHS